MSRIGKQPIAVPSGVDVTINGASVVVKGPRGQLQRTFSDRISVSREDGELIVARFDDERQSRALHGLSRALLNNMVVGVSAGYTRTLEIVGVGYRAAMKGNDLEIQVGYSHPVPYKAPDGISFETPSPTRIVVSGIDKEQVGQVCAEIRKIRKPEPYKGKGIRYEGEVVRRKAGKAAK
jgi:large subunit ribosomal protein L6